MTPHEKDFLRICKDGDIETVKKYIEDGININIQDGWGNTPLTLASESNITETVNLLIKHNVNIDIQDKENNTALILASRNGHVKTVDLLIKVGADTNIQNDDGDTALIWAVINNHIKTTESLIDAGADPLIKNSDNESALDRAKRHYENRHSEENKGILKLLENPPTKIDKQLSQIEWEEVYVI